jgi:hypothetical protein
MSYCRSNKSVQATAAARSKFPLLTLLDAPDFTRLATGNPKAGGPCHPGAAEAMETPGATLSRVRDTPRTGRKTEWPAAAPFLPRRAICNLENLPVAPELPLPPKDASWGRQARIWGGLSPGGAEQGAVRENVIFLTRKVQQNNFTPQPPPARAPITLTVRVTPHLSATSRQHCFHRTVPLYRVRPNSVKCGNAMIITDERVMYYQSW